MMTVSPVPRPFCNGHSNSATDRRCAAARQALAEMKGGQGWTAAVDASALDFLATEISEQMLRELARNWAPPAMGYPTSSKLAAMAERLYLQAAVAALDA